MRKQSIPATLYSEIVNMTKLQEAKVEKLESLGWIVVTPPESTFNGALLMEDVGGVSHFVHPNGTVE